MALLIRSAKVADAYDIAGLTAQLGYDLATDVVSLRLSHALSKSDQQLLVCELDGRLVGWVHATIWEFLETGRFGLIAGLVVDSNHRRIGIGCRLMEEAEHWIAKQGCSVVRLWSSAGRTAAHRFYEKLGYVNIKTQHSFGKVLDPLQGDILKSYVPQIEE